MSQAGSTLIPAKPQLLVYHNFQRISAPVSDYDSYPLAFSLSIIPFTMTILLTIFASTQLVMAMFVCLFVRMFVLIVLLKHRYFVSHKNEKILYMQHNLIFEGGNCEEGDGSSNPNALSSVSVLPSWYLVRKSKLC
jgi:hypothetical protein